MNKFKFATSSAIALVGLGLATPLPVLAETKPNVVSVDDQQTKIDNLNETISKLESTKGNDTTTPIQEDNNKSAEVETPTEETTRNSETKATDTNSQENSPVEDSKVDDNNTSTEDNKPIEVKYNTESQNKDNSNKELPKASISNLISLSLGMSLLGGASLKGKKRN